MTASSIRQEPARASSHVCLRAVRGFVTKNTEQTQVRVVSHVRDLLLRVLDAAVLTLRACKADIHTQPCYVDAGSRFQVVRCVHLCVLPVGSEQLMLLWFQQSGWNCAIGYCMLLCPEHTLWAEASMRSWV
jgi:hypothetical protein